MFLTKRKFKIVNDVSKKKEKFSKAFSLEWNHDILCMFMLRTDFEKHDL